MKWLPEARSRTKPLRSRNWTTSRGLTAGSLGILEIQRGNQRFVVGWDGLPMLLEALDITGDGVLHHLLRFRQSPSVGYTSGQGWHHGSKSALGFGPQDNVEATVRFLHGAILSEWPKGGQRNRGNLKREPSLPTVVQDRPPCSGVREVP